MPYLRIFSDLLIYSYKEIVYPLPVEDLLYVGPATSRKLRSVGVTTIGRLAECPEEFLVRRLGKMGAVLSMFANGRDVSPVQRSDHIPAVKSVGNSATTPRDLANMDDVRIMAYLLAESVAVRMRELASRCTVVEVSIRDTDLHWFSRQKKLRIPTCSSAEIAETALALFRANYHWEKPVRSIGVRGSGLVEAADFRQISLYEDDIRREKWERIDGAMDSIRQRYGYMSIRRAVAALDPVLGRINPQGRSHGASCGFFFGVREMEIREKKYVPVVVHFDADGRMRPMLIEFNDRQYEVDRILDVRRAVCESAGGVGERYTCRIQGRESCLWFEDGRWFVAAKQ